MKVKVRSLILSTALTAVAIQGFAQTGPGGRPQTRAGNSQSPQILYPGFGLPIINAQGNIKTDSSHTDVTPLMRQAMDEAFKRPREDKEFFVHSVNEVTNGFNDLYESVVVKRLTAWEGNAAQGNFIGVDEYVQGVSLYLEKKNAITNKIESLRTMAGALPSTQVTVTENTKTEIPAYLNIKMEPLANYYKKKLEEVDAFISTKTFLVKDKIGVQRPVQGLATANLKGFVAMTPAERTAKLSKILELRHVSEGFKSLQDKTTWLMKEISETFIKDMGEAERYRFGHGGDSFIKAKADYFANVANIAVVRSYMRLKSGVPMGTVGVTWKKRFANIETFLNSPYEYWQFSRQTLRAQTDLVKAKESYRNFVESANERSASIFTGNYGVLAKLNSFATTIRGYGPMMEAAAMVLRVLAADCAEELILQNPNGYENLKAMFKTRYLSTDESKKNTIAAICDLDPSASMCSGGPRGSEVISESGALGYERTLMAQLDNISYQFATARELDKAVKLLDSLNQSNNDLKKEADDRIGDLFK